MRAHDSADVYNHVVWQGDGNLVWYAGTHAIWASQTNGKHATRLVFQTDGNVVVYAGSKALWATGASRSKSSASRYFFQTVLYSNDPDFKYELEVFQQNPGAVLWNMFRVYNG